MVNEQVRFCRSFDGAQIAYAVTGRGAPLVLLPSWLTHLHYQWRSVAWRPWLEALSAGWRLLRYDPRGCGLSDRDVEDLSFDTWVRDLQAVLDAAGFERVALLGICQGGPVALALAAAHPDRVSRLVLHGAYARGRARRGTPLEPHKARVMLEMIELGWGDEDHAFMRAFATQFQPEGGLEHLSSWCELQRAATSAANAVRLTRAMFDLDLQEQARQVACPSLVMHAERDAVVPVEEGRLLARLIPNALFMELDSANHFLLPSEPAWPRALQGIADFLAPPAGEAGPFASLTAREREVLEYLARGLDNHQIAAHLDISEKTVRNHVSYLFAKLGVDTRARAIVLAREAGYGAPARSA